MSDEEKLPVTEVEFWRMRLVMAHVTGRGLHTAVYDTDPETWNSIQNETAGILSRYLYPGIKILDAGCAYGAVYALLPKTCEYVGVDVSPHFIEIAKLRHPEADFRTMDLAAGTPFGEKQFDLTICRSVKEMLVRNKGNPYWDQTLNELRRISYNILYMGYGGKDLDCRIEKCHS